MAIWLARAGARGEYEQKFIDEKRVYLTWDDLKQDLTSYEDRGKLLPLLEEVYPDSKRNTLGNWANQIRAFVHSMQRGDLIVVPLKSRPVVYIGEITGPYTFNGKAENPYYHFRTVEWIGKEIPRSNFAQDLLYSFGAFLTICQITRNDAESRILTMRKTGWKPEDLLPGNGKVSPVESEVSISELARDQIARLLIARLKGHGLEELVEGILRAKGYTTYRSPEGADGGVDILAGRGEMGFGEPRLCVQVKSQESPVEARVLQELKGVMATFGATEGLLVAWGGFKSSIKPQQHFFNVRLWGQNELLEELFACYEKLDEDLKVRLPLKKIWIVAAEDEE